MNFLQLAQRLGRECGVAGGVPSVLSQTGEYQRLVDWTNQAWVELQEEKVWRFRFADITPSPLTIGTQAYAATDFGVADFEAWDIGSGDGNGIYNDVTGSVIVRPDTSVRIYKGSLADEEAIPFLHYNRFRSIYNVGAQADNRPVCFTIGRDNKIMFGPTPDFAYTLNASYVKSAAEMAANTDIPTIPTSLHMMIVYKAMQYYGAYEEAGEVYNRGLNEYARLMPRLNRLEKETTDLAFGCLA